MIKEILAGIILAVAIILFVILFYAAYAFIFMIVWNFFMPWLFGLPTVGFKMSAAIVIIFSIVNIRGRCSQ